MESLLILSALIIFVLFLNYFLLKYDFLVDKKNLIHKSFISKNPNYKLIVDFVDENIDLTKGVIIEFKIINGDCFIPYRIRSDKNKPNGEITVNNTLKNIEESIKIEELV